MGAHDFSFNAIDGKPLELRSLAGRPILLVNVAS
jgi:glutathione peroxidase